MDGAGIPLLPKKLSRLSSRLDPTRCEGSDVRDFRARLAAVCNQTVVEERAALRHEPPSSQRALQFSQSLARGSIVWFEYNEPLQDLDSRSAPILVIVHLRQHC